MKKIFPLLGLFFGIVSCNPKEVAVEINVPEGIQTTQVDMGGDYEYQIYYSFTTNKEVSRNLKSAWDIAFESTETGYHILLNSSKLMYASKITNRTFEAITDTTGYEANKKIDNPNGDFNETAINDWRTDQPTYLLNLGIIGITEYGFAKFQPLSVDEDKYIFRYQILGDNKIDTIEILKDLQYNLVHFSLLESKPVAIEPLKDNWDLCFTQYTQQIPIDYMVTGVLTNKHHIISSQLTSSNFSNINIDSVQSLTYTSDANQIGYEWKAYDFNSGRYTVNPNKIFVLKKDQVFIKMRFIDFYNAAGSKGAPKWEYEYLQP